MTTAQISNGSTVKSSWVVQIAQLTKDDYAAREEKHSGRNGSHHRVDPSAVAHPQLREVLSQVNHYTTPPAIRSAPTPNSSLRLSPYGTPKEVYASGTPRRSPDNPPRMLKVKEVRRLKLSLQVSTEQAATPEHGEGMNAVPATTSSPYQKAAAPAPAISREASLATPALPSAGTGPASGANQGTSDSQHPPPSQGVPVSVHPPTNPAPRLTRPKVTIDEVPESPQFGNKWTASPLQTQTHVLAQSEAPVAFASVPAAKVQSSDSNAHEKAPKPKDSFVPSVQPAPNVQSTVAVKPSPSVQPNPSGQPTSTVKPSPSAQPTPSVQPTPTAVASTSSHVPPAPSTQQHA
jgi:hypothetical protein